MLINSNNIRKHIVSLPDTEKKLIGQYKDLCDRMDKAENLHDEAAVCNIILEVQKLDSEIMFFSIYKLNVMSFFMQKHPNFKQN